MNAAAESARIERAKRDASVAAELQGAILEADAEACLAGCRELLAFDPDLLKADLAPVEVQLRRTSHEIADSALREVLLADATAGDAWKKIMLPNAAGMIAYSLWIANVKWLRMLDSSLPGQGLESLDLARFGTLDLVDQAKALGRYCLVNDGARELAIDELCELLDPRLLPFFSVWLLGVFCQSPDGCVDAATEARQSKAAAQLERGVAQRATLVTNGLVIGAAYDEAYRSAGSLRATAEFVNGGLVRELFARFVPTEVADQRRWPTALAVEAAEAAILCPNWRDEHVAFRCLSPLVEDLRASGAPVLMVHESASPVRGQKAEGWRDQSIDHCLRSDRHLFEELGDYAARIAEGRLDFLFYPEILPSNSTAWLATQRLARVQATAYGYPVTSGSPAMDYFVGGQEIERELGAEQDYCEQLVLLPGFGVTTTEPPQASRPRQRPIEDAQELRLVSVASHRKLNRSLLEAWDSILGFHPGAVLDLFPAMTQREAERHAPAMGALLQQGQVDLHPTVERQAILDCLVEADVYLDTYPFGGFNSLVEVLTSGCPMVTLEGDQARNRFGAAMLRRLGMPDFLIASDWPSYIAAARRVMEDGALRADLRARLADREAVLATLIDHDMGAHFAEAQRWMLEQGPRRGQRPGAPVLIRAGERPRVLNS